jgi:hypothetical protein
MTYKELLEILLKADADELKQNVTVWDPDIEEYRPAIKCHRVLPDLTDILDVGHLVIRLTP